MGSSLEEWPEYRVFCLRGATANSVTWVQPLDNVEPLSSSAKMGIMIPSYLLHSIKSKQDVSEITV